MTMVLLPGKFDGDCLTDLVQGLCQINNLQVWKLCNDFQLLQNK